jgi:hypothetical protein
MSKRKVIIKLTTQQKPIEHETNARTFGELKAELTDIKWSGMRVVEKTNKTTLQMDESILPAGDFILFVVPEKVKSGAVESIDDVDTADYNTLRSYISFLNKVKGQNIAMDGGVGLLRMRVKDYLNENGAAQTLDPKSRIEEARSKINEAIDVIIEHIGNVSSSVAAEVAEDTEEYIIKLSVKDLDDELLAIKENLGL